jgi:hypothetical protein
MGKIGGDFGQVLSASEIARLLNEHGMRERDGILEQDFANGETMQVRLGEDRVLVYSRKVRPGAAEPEWIDSTGYVLAEWIRNDSPVWKWLKFKGIDEAKTYKHMLKFK